MGWEVRVETDYVVLRYPPPPHTINPPHQIATILEESVIVFRRFRIPTKNSQFTMWYRSKLTLRLDASQDQSHWPEPVCGKIF